MKKFNSKIALLSALGVLAVSGVVAGIAFAGGDNEEAEIALPAAQVVRAINAASAAKAGNIAGVEMETDKGVAHVDVEIAAADGKKYEVSVNAQTGKVMSVEADDEAGEQNEAGEKDETDKD